MLRGCPELSIYTILLICLQYSPNNKTRPVWISKKTEIQTGLTGRRDYMQPPVSTLVVDVSQAGAGAGVAADEAISTAVFTTSLTPESEGLAGRVARLVLVVPRAGRFGVVMLFLL
ncbi:MAG TPA: hypothetical protein VFH06_04700 [Candidatus Saccharimonadales bacterium]|nr:hypothetical protein [Candidatus Saccharimonadales bacterium]